MKEQSSTNNKVKKRWKKWNGSDGAEKNSKNYGDTSKNYAPRNQKFKKQMEIKEIKCYCCRIFVHCARECYFNKESNENDNGVTEFALAESNDSKEVILIANTHLAQNKTNI